MGIPSAVLMAIAAIGTSDFVRSADGVFGPPIILQQVVNQSGELKNVHVVSRWQNMKKKGKRTRYTQTDDLDRFGRRRHRSVSKGLEKKLAKHKGLSDGDSDLLCDGVITVKRRWQETVTQEERDADPSSGGAASGQKAHWSAMIYEANSKPGMEQGRTPLTFMSNIFVMQLTKLLVADSKTVNVTWADDSKREVLEIHWTNLSNPLYRYEALVWPQQGWTVSSYRRYRGDHLLDEYDGQYKQSSSGHWLPTSGSHRYWSLPQDGEAKSKEPAHETQFEVTEIKVNDPEFDESVFDVVFETGTYVNDIRLQTSYTVGDDKNFEALMKKIVQRARKKQPRGDVVAEPAKRALRDILVVVMPACIVLVAHLLFVRSGIGRQDGEDEIDSSKDRQSK